MDGVTRERWLGPGLVVLLAMGLRAWAPLREPILFDDGPRFLVAARLMLEGHYQEALADAYHPLTALLIALTSYLSGVGLESAGILISILAGGVATLTLYLLARDLFGDRVALVAAMLLAVYPRMVAASSNVQSDGLHLALFLIGALLVWRSLERGTLRDGAGAGIVCGLAYLTRPEGIAVGVVLGGWLLADLATKRIGWRRFLTASGGFAVPVLLFGGTYALSLSAGGGELVLSQKKSLMPAGLDVFSIGRLAPAFWEVMRDFQEGWEAFWLFVVLAFRWQRPSRATLYLASFTLLFFVLLIAVHLEAGYVSRRHWLAPAALLLPFAALGILRVGDLVRDRLSEFGGGDWVPAACVAAVVAGFAGHELMRSPEAVKLARKEAALWLRQYDVEAVSAERARSAYYAAAERHIPFVAVSDPILLRDRLRLAGAEFVIAEETALPALPAEGIPGLSEVHRVAYPGGHVLVLRIDAVQD